MFFFRDGVLVSAASVEEKCFDLTEAFAFHHAALFEDEMRIERGSGLLGEVDSSGHA